MTEHRLQALEGLIQDAVQSVTPMLCTKCIASIQSKVASALNLEDMQFWLTIHFWWDYTSSEFDSSTLELYGVFMFFTVFFLSSFSLRGSHAKMLPKLLHFLIFSSLSHLRFCFPFCVAFLPRFSYLQFCLTFYFTFSVWNVALFYSYFYNHIIKTQ